MTLPSAARASRVGGGSLRIFARRSRTSLTSQGRSGRRSIGSSVGSDVGSKVYESFPCDRDILPVARRGCHVGSRPRPASPAAGAVTDERSDSHAGCTRCDRAACVGSHSAPGAARLHGLRAARWTAGLRPQPARPPLRGGRRSPSACAPEPPACLAAAPCGSRARRTAPSPDRLDARVCGACRCAVRTRWPVRARRAQYPL